MNIRWTSRLATGNTIIDNQHKEVIKSLNSFLISMKAGKGKEELKNTIYYFEKYVNEHFKYEEKYMHDNNYPNLDQHIEVHKMFKRDLEDMKAEFELKGATTYFTILIQKRLIEWLMNHIHDEDLKYAKYIKNK